MCGLSLRRGWQRSQGTPSGEASLFVGAVELARGKLRDTGVTRGAGMVPWSWLAEPCEAVAQAR